MLNALVPLDDAQAFACAGTAKRIPGKPPSPPLRRSRLAARRWRAAMPVSGDLSQHPRSHHAGNRSAGACTRQQRKRLGRSRPAGMGQSLPHREPAEKVVAALGSDVARGLSRAEARRRLERYGPNRLKSAPETPWWQRLLEQFENFLVIILLVATVISVVEWLLQDPRESALPYEAIVILAIVILNALLGFFQEARAEKSVRALMALAAPEVDGDPRRRAPAHRRPRDRSGRHRAGRGRRQDPGRRPPHRGGQSPYRRGAADRREHAGARRTPGRSTRDVGLGDRRNMLYSEHGRHLWPRPRRGRRDRHGDRGRPHRRPARSRREGADAAPAGARPHRQAPQRRSCSGICAVVFATGLLSSTDLDPQRRSSACSCSPWRWRSPPSPRRCRRS